MGKRVGCKARFVKLYLSINSSWKEQLASFVQSSLRPSLYLVPYVSVPGTNFVSFSMVPRYL